MENKRKYIQSPPVLYGLILAGGKSSRMGRDKALISYHGKSQWSVLFDLTQKFCMRTFLSLRKDQQNGIATEADIILDRDEYPGPFNGILSAHKAFPEAAWLVLACDLPLIDHNTLQLLVDARDPSKDATALATQATQLPEPLAAIWEPQALNRVPDYLNNATSSCPRKFLLNSDISLVIPPRDEVLANANSMEDYERIRQVLGSK